MEKDGNIYAAGVQVTSAKLETVSARKQERFTDVGFQGPEIVPGSLVLEGRMHSKLLQVTKIAASSQNGFKQPDLLQAAQIAACSN